MEARRDREAVRLLLDCDACRQMTRREMRQMWACPYEPQREGAAAGFVPVGWLEEHPRADRPRTCIGYTTKLPGVAERTWQLHWLKTGGWEALRAQLGREPTEDDMAELRVLEAEQAAAASWAMENPKKRDP